MPVIKHIKVLISDIVKSAVLRAKIDVIQGHYT